VVHACETPERVEDSLAERRVMSTSSVDRGLLAGGIAIGAAERRLAAGEGDEAEAFELVEERPRFFGRDRRDDRGS